MYFRVEVSFQICGNTVVLCVVSVDNMDISNPQLVD